jgi:hypothetical protein
MADINLIDEIYLALEDLAGENLDKIIDDKTYIIRKLRLLDLCDKHGITKQDLSLARARRYGASKVGA